MIAALFTLPLVMGAVLLVIGLYARDRWLRAGGEALLAVACVLMVIQLYMIADFTSHIEYGLFLSSWSDYAGFACILLLAGLLAGDAIYQALSKKSYSS